MCDMRRNARVEAARTLLLTFIMLLFTSPKAEITLENIKNEGFACLDLAAALPRLADSIRKFTFSITLATYQHPSTAPLSI